MKFGTFVFQTQPSTITAIAHKAEELGFESLWIPEHILLPVNYKSPYPYSSTGRMPAPPESPLHDPMLVLAYVAAITTKIRLATGIYVLPIRNPFTTAKAVASLDVLSGGRFIFGVGIGWLEEEFEGVGSNFKDRALRSREYVELLKELWRSDDPVYHGKTVSIEGFKMNPKPVQKPHPPFVFGGSTEPSLRRTARLGDGWYGIGETLEETARVIKRLREHETGAASQPAAGTHGRAALRRSNYRRSGEAPARYGRGAGASSARLPRRVISFIQMERFRDDVMTKF